MSARFQFYLPHYSTLHKLKNCLLSLSMQAASKILYIKIQHIYAKYSTKKRPYFKNFTPSHHVSCEKVANFILCSTALV